MFAVWTPTSFKPGREKDYGIGAISLSRSFTQGDLVCFADESEGRAFVNATLQWLIDENREAWGVNGSEGFHERIVAVMFHLAVPWDMNGQRLVHTADGKPRESRQLHSRMGNADEESAFDLLTESGRRWNAGGKTLRWLDKSVDSLVKTPFLRYATNMSPECSPSDHSSMRRPETFGFLFPRRSKAGPG